MIYAKVFKAISTDNRIQIINLLKMNSLWNIKRVKYFAIHIISSYARIRKK